LAIWSKHMIMPCDMSLDYIKLIESPRADRWITGTRVAVCT
jgi:hypothetical protein